MSKPLWTDKDCPKKHLVIPEGIRDDLQILALLLDKGDTRIVKFMTSLKKTP